MIPVEPDRIVLILILMVLSAIAFSVSRNRKIAKKPLWLGQLPVIRVGTVSYHLGASDSYAQVGKEFIFRFGNGQIELHVPATALPEGFGVTPTRLLEADELARARALAEATTPSILR